MGGDRRAMEGKQGKHVRMCRNGREKDVPAGRGGVARAQAVPEDG